MIEQNPVVFFPGKLQLIPIAINIAISPLLLFLSGLWPWPPSMLHLSAFIVTSILAFQFVRRGLARPRLIFDEAGIHYAGVSYDAESIVAIQPYMRALRVWVLRHGKEKEKIINLWWAGKDDIKKIYETAVARFEVRS